MGTLSLLVFLRVLGVFLVLVGFADHWRSLGGSEASSGFGFAAYAFALALFLLPLGAASDKFGRRNVMFFALAVSVFGGFLAAFATTPLLFALGRFVQGAGAINGIALAVAGEIGIPGERTRRMAILGAAAGGGVIVGLLSSAFLHRVGVTIPQILIAFSVVTLFTLPLVWRSVPERGIANAAGGARKISILALAAFAVNFSLAGLLLYSKPLLERAAPGVPYEVALLVMLVPGGLGMFLTSRLADKGHARAVGLSAAALLGVMPVAFLFTPGVAVVLLAGVLFFVGHSALSSLLPSLAARAGAGGAGQGAQSTLQYFGSAVGTSVVGVLFAVGATGGLVVAFVGMGLVAAFAIANAT